MGNCQNGGKIQREEEELKLSNNINKKLPQKKLSEQQVKFRITA